MTAGWLIGLTAGITNPARFLMRIMVAMTLRAALDALPKRTRRPKTELNAGSQNLRLPAPPAWVAPVTRPGD